VNLTSPLVVRNQRNQTAQLKHTYTALDPPTPRQGAKNLDGALCALTDLIPPLAFVNLTSPLVVRNQRNQTAQLKHTYTALDPPTPRQGAKNLDGAWTALGMDLIPPLATVNLTSPKAQAPPPQAAGKLRLWVDLTTRHHSRSMAIL